MSIWVLGVNAFHADASACLLKDGEIVAAVAEERLGLRKKHFAGFPAEAIKRVLEIGKINIQDVSHVALGHDPKANGRQKLKFAMRNPVKSIKSAATYLKRKNQIDNLRTLISKECGFLAEDCKFEIHQIEHHLAHIASSFWTSGFEHAASFTYDSSGDFVSTTFGECNNSGINIIDKVYLPHSLGYFYTAMCQFIGFDHFGEEYKVMGLGAYGQPRYLKNMEKMLMIAKNGKFELSEKFFSGLLQKPHEDLLDQNGQIVIPPLYSQGLVEEFGPPRQRNSELTQREKDIAASCQLHFENVVLNSLNWLHSQTMAENLVTAGGCALNGVCNARILRETPFKNMYIHGAAGDDGTCVGAALHVWNSKLGGSRSPQLEHSYLGPSYSSAAIRHALQTSGIQANEYPEEEIPKVAAKFLQHGKVLGWYQDRSEWGPRALGNRSIIAHPGWPNMKDLINAKIKRRESFRPFAPSVISDYARTVFEQDVQSPFMMHVIKIRQEYVEQLSAVCHEDNTGRVHTVSQAQNKKYYNLISEFHKLSGIPVVLNTSFNENEPIVDTPEQAIGCFLRSDIDVLVLGNFVAVKTKNES